MTNMPLRMARMSCVFALAAALDHAEIEGARDALEPVSRYCRGCHNERARLAGLVLNPASIGEDTAVWEKVARKLEMRHECLRLVCSPVAPPVESNCVRQRH